MDHLPIVFDHFSFSYVSGAPNKMISCAGRQLIQQGQLICIVGPRAVGKTTLLNILSRVTLPPATKVGEPSFYIPAHLRPLLVRREPQFVHGTIYSNLIFGVKPGDSDASVSRVQEICRMVGLSEATVCQIREDSEDKDAWMKVLSETDATLLNLARALVANPEILCVYKPMSPFDDVMSNRMMQLFKRFVEDRGLQQNDATRHERRPRTCIITVSKVQFVEAADVVVHVDCAGGIQVLSPRAAGRLESLLLQ